MVFVCVGFRNIERLSTLCHVSYNLRSRKWTVLWISFCMGYFKDGYTCNSLHLFRVCSIFVSFGSHVISIL
jgi:hypothetical protein